MAKKKKSQLKPVARGFATTSVPKKPVVADVEPASQDGDISEAPTYAAEGDASGEVNSLKVNVNAGGSTAVHGFEFDPVKAEEQSWQNVVDKHQEKTEKEIIRTIKACPLILLPVMLPCKPFRCVGN